MGSLTLLFRALPHNLPRDLRLGILHVGRVFQGICFDLITYPREVFKAQQGLAFWLDGQRMSIQVTRKPQDQGLLSFFGCKPPPLALN